MVNVYAILDADGRCINRVLWDGESPWQPPSGCTAIEDPDNLYPIVPVSLEVTVANIDTTADTAIDLTQSDIL